jgi:hypothetical protein
MKSRTVRSLIAKRNSAFLAAACLFAFQRYAFSQVGVLTYHNNNARTGQNTNETALTLANVTTSTFGKVYCYPVDGYIYAQPLVMPNVTMPNGVSYNVLIIATEHDSVYAFDADNTGGTNTAPLWQTSFIDPSSGVYTPSSDSVNCGDLVPEVGITSTPVIDPTSGTIYVEAKTLEIVDKETTFVHRLHALDITTGAEKFGGPVLIQPSVPGSGDGNDGNGNVLFNSRYQLNRPALLLVNGVVYVAFASHCDNSPFHGWLLGFDAQSLAPAGVFNTTPNGGLGGIWQGGGGPASDADGNIYVITGNGTFDGSTNSDYGDCFLKFSPTNGLVLQDYFSPYNEQFLADNDEDLGSGGVVLLPCLAGSTTQSNLMVGAGKMGAIYLLDRDNLGHFNPNGDTQIVQSLPGIIGECYSTPAYFNNTLYYVGEANALTAFAISDGLVFAAPIAQSPGQFGFPGATPSISANGTNDAIVWAIESDGYDTNAPAILHAYEAADVTQELYNSAQAGTRDVAGPAVKFTVPTIANGKVYVGGEYMVTVYGELAAPPTLQIAISNDGQIMLSWTPPISGRLQMTSELSPTNTVWTDVGTNSPVTLNIGADKSFFRVVSP